MSGSKSIVSLDTARVGRTEAGAESDDRLRRLQRRVEREHAARHAAERLLESKSLELFELNQRLLQLNLRLEERVSERTEELDQARKAALELVDTDHLTGIPSRSRYARHLTVSLARAASGGSLTGLLLIDIDNFKFVNDTFGHNYGDQLLITVAKRLHERTRHHEMVARIGGDEFAIVLEGPDRSSLVNAAERFHQAFRSPVSVLGVTLRSSGSLGLAVGPTDTNCSADLQRFADLALYKVKAAGGDGIAVFDRSLLDAYENRQRIEGELREALVGSGFSVWFQPIFDIVSGQIESVEALARWSNGLGRQIEPDVFIPLAEQCGLISELGRQLLRKALRQSKEWVGTGLVPKLNFNVSPLELLHDGCAEGILRILDEEAFSAGHLVLEITEGAVLQNVGGAVKVMNRLRRHGIAFALDDFGSGYSNLSSLRRLPISFLKMDRSLVVDLERDDAAKIIIRNVIKLCHDMGIRSVGEGVETTEQLHFLREVGCDAAQGYLCGRPGSAEDVAATLLQHAKGR